MKREGGGGGADLKKPFIVDPGNLHGPEHRTKSISSLITNPKYIEQKNDIPNFLCKQQAAIAGYLVG